MDENEVLKELKTRLGDAVIEAKIPRKRRIFVKVKVESFRKSARFLVKELGFKHISTITGVDLGNSIELIYHLAYQGSIELSLKVDLPKREPKISTITDLIPGAILYEREVHDLLGVVFEGHPDLSPLLLPEKWPKGIHPLRKEYSLESIRKTLFKG